MAASTVRVTEFQIDRLSEARLALIHPLVAERAGRMIVQCAGAGIPILITQGLRTCEEQDALYARGRTVPPLGQQHIVTKARGGYSWHNFGLAFDIVVLDAIGKANWDTKHPAWAQAAAVGKSLGLEWGGDWRGFKDLPHFQYTGGLSLAECRKLMPLGLAAIWERIR